MFIGVAIAAAIGLVQSVAWLGRPTATVVQQRTAVWLAPVCLLVLGLALTAWRVPGLLG